MLKVFEIFNSFQGEGPNSGKPTIFIRMSGCNLACKWCFGERDGRRKPYLIYSDKSNKKLSEAKIGDKLLTYNNNDMTLVETTVTDTMTREVDSWYKIKIDGTLYFVTPEHPFFTNRGMVIAEDLLVGDQILHSTFNDKLSFRMSGKRNIMHDQDVKRRSILNTDYAEIGKKISDTIDRQKREGTYIPSWNKLTPEKIEELSKRVSERQQGSNNTNWKKTKNIAPNRAMLRQYINSGHVTTCDLCTSTRNIEIHHVDGNSNNDNVNNLTVLCKSCHSKIHEKGYNFWENGRIDKLNPESQEKFKNRLVDNGTNGKEVQQIIFVNINDEKYYPSTKPKPLTVYNVSCEPYNSYLVDYMWVHNCDTKDSWDEEKSTLLSADEIMNHVLIKDSYVTNVCITGGEPLLQQEDQEFVLLLMKLQAHFKIEMETNGTIMPSIQTTASVDQFNISPKLLSTGSLNPVNTKILRDIFLAGWNDIAYKFVVDTSRIELCLDEIRSICVESEIENDLVWLMPLGINKADIIKNTSILMNSDHPYNVSSRNHIIFNQR